ncbi:MAG: hypothetical protein JWN67_3890 [Actinomycetia bacterium]|nr:hypothetical protein [Actinomycetes bacterium]
MEINGPRADDPGVRSIALAVAAALVAGLLALAAPAHADEPLFVDWTSLLPSLTNTYEPSSANDCSAGRSSCVGKTIREMQRRFDPLAHACNPNAVFALAYLRTTQTYEWARDQQGFFDDTPFVNHEDAVFARYYFDAYDDWAAGRRGEVPQAWLTALDAGAGHQVSGVGGLFLGMSAHVNRDLPYVLADIGLTYPDGSSRKADHDKVNQFLNAVLDPLLAEEAARFDPAVDDAHDPLLLGYTTMFQLLAVWREAAWRNAERLVSAPTPAARAQVAQSIEDYAAGMATTIKLATSYVWPLTTSASQDAYCSTHKSASAPIAYAFGMPSPW